jgi:hypothetical protein
MKNAILALGGLSVSLTTGSIFFTAIVPAAIAQTDPILIEIPKSNFFGGSPSQQNNSLPNVEIPKSNFFGESTATPPQTTPQNIPQPTPQKKLSDTADDLKTEGNKVTDESNQEEQKRLSPLQRPLFRLFGFESAYTLKQQELVFRILGNSFNNPLDFRGDSNRSNDTTIGLVYGITDNVQVSVDVTGKDDTVFTNLVRPNTAFQLFAGTIPITVKWKYLEENDLTAAAVFSAEFASPFPTLFTRGGRSIIFSNSNCSQAGTPSIIPISQSGAFSTI